MSVLTSFLSQSTFYISWTLSNLSQWFYCDLRNVLTCTKSSLLQCRYKGECTFMNIYSWEMKLKYWECYIFNITLFLYYNIQYDCSSQFKQHYWYHQNVGVTNHFLVSKFSQLIFLLIRIIKNTIIIYLL